MNRSRFRLVLVLLVRDFFAHSNHSNEPKHGEYQLAYFTQVLVAKLDRARLQQVGLAIILGQAVSRTRHELEELRHGQEEIENLRNEEKQQELAEMAENSDDSERHASEIAERVAHKHSTGIAIVEKEWHRARYERYDEIHRKDLIVTRGRVELEHVAHKHAHGDDERLADLDAVDAGVDIDSVRAKHGQHAHVDIVE